MEVNAWFNKVKGIFVSKSNFSSKTELNIAALKWFSIAGIVIFVSTVLLLPDEIPTQFSEKLEPEKQDVVVANSVEIVRKDASNQLWSAPKKEMYRSGSASEGQPINYNTSMVLGSGRNAKTQLHAGVRLRLRILDKVIVSQDSVPILAELILDSETNSGLRLSAGTKLYGEASFMKGADRAAVAFKQMSLINGQMRAINAKAVGLDGQGGIPGRIYSDSTKNTAGQVLTSFVGGLAAGSVQTDIFGRSQGGLTNGVLTAVSETAKANAQSYGEKLKAEREWIEISPNTECDAQLFESLDLQTGDERE